MLHPARWTVLLALGGTGPYMSGGIGADSWNNRYMVNNGVIDNTQGTQNSAGATKTAVWVISAGANGQIETPPTQAITAAVLDQCTATGRDMYGPGSTERDIYEGQADIIPGNSGGPLIAKDGSVIGVIFAQSTSYEHVGYALTTAPVISAIKHAEAAQNSVSTGKCAE